MIWCVFCQALMSKSLDESLTLCGRQIRETLSHSSLTGRQSGAHKDVESKPQLDNTKLDAIIGHALSKFPDISVQDVRRIIRKKCNNESYTKQATAKKTM
ncbi:hypothetical protein MHYP_G00086970 [Metynnis hypsauchen]